MYVLKIDVNRSVLLSRPRLWSRVILNWETVWSPYRGQKCRRSKLEIERIAKESPYRNWKIPKPSGKDLKNTSIRCSIVSTNCSQAVNEPMWTSLWKAKQWHLSGQTKTFITVINLMWLLRKKKTDHSYSASATLSATEASNLSTPFDLDAIYNWDGTFLTTHKRGIIHVMDQYKISKEAYHELSMQSKGYLPPIGQIMKEKHLMSDSIPYEKHSSVRCTEITDICSYVMEYATVCILIQLPLHN